MEAQRRSRPNLEPLWTEHYAVGGYPRTAFRTARSSHAVSPSPRSPKTVPSPMYPSSPGHDNDMRKHEQALVERLDARNRNGPLLQTPTSVLSPNTEQAVVSRLEKVSVNSPIHPRVPIVPPPPPTPASASPLEARRQTIAAETRSMLLSGVPENQASSLGAVVDRRQSAPAEVMALQRRNSLLLFQEQLQAWGHVHFGNAANADIFVAAVSTRRQSGSSSSGEEQDKGPSDRATIRARVRPRDLERKPFLITREFDLVELRSTIPQGRPSPTGTRRSSLDVAGKAASPAARRRSGLRSSDRVLRSSANLGAARQVVPGTKEVPIHLPYARAYLPVLAALMLSGHIHGKDVIDLPMPYPEVWHQTVAYVYTGQGELTDAMMQNILHLGGRP